MGSGFQKSGRKEMQKHFLYGKSRPHINNIAQVDKCYPFKILLYEK